MKSVIAVLIVIVNMYSNTVLGQKLIMAYDGKGLVVYNEDNRSVSYCLVDKSYVVYPWDLSEIYFKNERLYVYHEDENSRDIGNGKLRYSYKMFPYPIGGFEVSERIKLGESVIKLVSTNKPMTQEEVDDLYEKAEEYNQDQGFAYHRIVNTDDIVRVSVLTKSGNIFIVGKRKAYIVDPIKGKIKHTVDTSSIENKYEVMTVNNNQISIIDSQYNIYLLVKNGNDHNYVLRKVKNIKTDDLLRVQIVRGVESDRLYAIRKNEKGKEIYKRVFFQGDVAIADKLDDVVELVKQYKEIENSKKIQEMLNKQQTHN